MHVQCSDISKWKKGMEIYGFSRWKTMLYHCMTHAIPNMYVYIFLKMKKLKDFVRDVVCTLLNELYFEWRGSRRIARQQWMTVPNIMQLIPGNILGNKFMYSHVPLQKLMTKGETTKRERNESPMLSIRFFHRGKFAAAKTLRLQYKIRVSNGPSLVFDIILMPISYHG